MRYLFLFVALTITVAATAGMGLQIPLVARAARARLSANRRIWNSPPSSLSGDVSRCTKRWIKQKLNHFGGASNGPHFKQRYFECIPKGVRWTAGDPIFYYTGNEADVMLYVTHTGFMWEHAPLVNAKLIFAEHRYFGASSPFPGPGLPTPRQLKYLSVEQAMADYAHHIKQLKRASNDSPVVLFGGSYGGMLAAWMRITYPTLTVGALAASAPVAAFEGMWPAFDPNSFAAVVTSDAHGTHKNGSLCQYVVKLALQELLNAVLKDLSPKPFAKKLGLCENARTSEALLSYLNYANGAFSNMAMGSYPYPSSYMLFGGKGMLPAYPLRKACDRIVEHNMFWSDLPKALSAGVMLYYNATGNLNCVNPNAAVNKEGEEIDYLWSYLACTQIVIPSGIGNGSMFPASPWDIDSMASWCKEVYGVVPDPYWASKHYSRQRILNSGTNIIFSNGLLDPWRPGGILEGAGSVSVYTIADVGHHVDLMFSNPMDTQETRSVRHMEFTTIQGWLGEHRK